MGSGFGSAASGSSGFVGAAPKQGEDAKGNIICVSHM
jgi:hypothetical protein